MNRTGQITMDRERLGIKSLAERRMRLSGAKPNHKREAICSCCGRIGDMHAHHPDYNRPEVVVWVCKFCHSARQKFDRDAGRDCCIDGRFTGYPKILDRQNQSERQPSIGGGKEKPMRRACEGGAWA